MYFGAHVSIAGGVFNSPLNAAHLGAEVFQIFTRSPHGGSLPPLTQDVLALFKQNLRDTGIPSFYIHTPYFINFASNTNRIRYGSVSVVKQELERGSLLGAKYVMTHLGSYKDTGEKDGYALVVEGLEAVLKDYKGSTKLLIENSAGSGEVIGDTFDELAEILNHSKLNKYDIGICFDTQHAFASGYDLRTKEDVNKTFLDFDKSVGLKKLKMFHCNDSMVDLAHHSDRHEHIGKGKIGKTGFEEILKHFFQKDVDFILETKPAGVVEDLVVLKKIRNDLV